VGGKVTFGRQLDCHLFVRLCFTSSLVQVSARSSSRGVRDYPTRTYAGSEARHGCLSVRPIGRHVNMREFIIGQLTPDMQGRAL